MSLRFTNWYTQALGATLGIIACIYAYLNGFMFVYGNIESYFDFLGFTGVISSYILFPLCVLNLILAIIKAYNSDIRILNISLKNINMFFTILTVIVGFMGAKIYFTIPALFIMFNLFSYKLNETLFNNFFQDSDEESAILDNKEQTFCSEKITTLDEIHTSKLPSNLPVHLKGKIERKIIDKNAKIAISKKEMAIDLLSKNADINFITEVTGLKKSEIEEMKNNMEA